MNFDLEMQRALGADGEKLRQLTGEDHGPWVLTVCPCCDGAGEWDEGPLPASSGATEPDYRQVICGGCEGTGRAFVPAEPIDLDDLAKAEGAAPCTACLGTGQIDGGSDQGDTWTCIACDGTGSVSDEGGA